MFFSIQYRHFHCTSIMFSIYNFSILHTQDSHSTCAPVLLLPHFFPKNLVMTIVLWIQPIALAFNVNKYGISSELNFQVIIIEERILEAKTECKGRVRRVFNHFTTISSHFVDTYLYIFHKTEDQMVILRCWTGLNHNWFKSYDTKCNAGQKE